jgi:hypothetical protein
MPGGDKTTPQQKVTAQEKRNKALQLRLAGASYRRICDEGVYANPGTACREVNRAIREITKESASAVVALELERLDIAMMGIWAAVRSGDVFAIDRMLKIMDTRARYLGLYGMPAEDNTEQVKTALTDFFAGAVAAADALDAADAEAAKAAAGADTIAGELVADPGTL